MSDNSMTTMKVRQINKNKVYNYIFEHKTTCKLEITRALNMGLSTVTQNLKTLEQDGLIQKNGLFESTGGRKAFAVEIVSEAKISIGIAILKESFDLVAVNLYGNAVASKTISAHFEQNESYFKLVSDNLNQFINENQIENILGVSIAMQGIISRDGKKVTYGEILVNQTMTVDDFTQFIKYPCRMEHDAKAAARLELWNNKEIGNATVFLLNTNLGGAIICNNRVQYGDSMRTGTIEHICMDKDGEECYCGKKGCLETYCSASALKATANMDIGRFFDLLLQEDENCLGIWKNYLTKLSDAIRLLYTIMDAKIIISGYLAWYFKDSDIKYILDQVNESATFKLKESDIILSSQGSYTQAIGTALFYTKQFLAAI